MVLSCLELFFYSVGRVLVNPPTPTLPTDVDLATKPYKIEALLMNKISELFTISEAGLQALKATKPFLALICDMNGARYFMRRKLAANPRQDHGFRFTVGHGHQIDVSLVFNFHVLPKMLHQQTAGFTSHFLHGGDEVGIFMRWMGCHQTSGFHS